MSNRKTLADNVVERLAELGLAPASRNVINPKRHAPVHLYTLNAWKPGVTILDVSIELANHKFFQQHSNFKGTGSVRPIMFVHNDGSFVVALCTTPGEVVAVTIQFQEDRV